MATEGLSQRLHRSNELKRLAFLNRWHSAFPIRAVTSFGHQSHHLKIGGRIIINFATSNHLGLERHPSVLNAFVKGARDFTRALGYVQLEHEIANFVGADDALMCSSMGEVHEGAIPALFSGHQCVLFIDRSAQSKMYRASLVARARGAYIEYIDVFDDQALAEKLGQFEGKTKALLIDGINCIHGQIPPLKRLADLCKEHSVVLYINDAHGFGARGATGAGVLEEFGLRYENLLVAGTLEQGAGGFGGFLAGQKNIIDLLRLKMKSYMYSRPPLPHAITGALAALKIIRSPEGLALRQRLREKALYVRFQAQELGFLVDNSDTPIIALRMRGDLRAMLAVRKLFDEGVHVDSALYPAAHKGQGCVRISLSATHTDEDFEVLINALASLNPANPNLRNLSSTPICGTPK